MNDADRGAGSGDPALRGGLTGCPRALHCERRHAGSSSRGSAASSRSRQHPAKAAGFTLIEVIVAFMMLALALTLLLGTLSGASRQVRHSEDSGRAALHAQSLLDQVGIGEPLRAGRSDGALDGGRYRWSLQVAPWREPGRAVPLPTAGAPQMMEVVLDISWGDQPRQRLQSRTLRLILPAELL